MHEGDLSISHIVTISTKIHDTTAIAAACQRLNLPAAVEDTAQLYSGEATGWIVHLPDWQYPVVIEPLSGTVHFDNFEGIWGERAKLDLFLQAYAVEKSRIEARKRGYAVAEQTLADGTIKLQILEGS